MRTTSSVGLGPLSQRSSRTSRSQQSGDAPALTIDQARENVRAAAAELVASIRSLTTETRPVRTTSLVSVAPVAAFVHGRAARLHPVIGLASLLQTTQKINTRTDTTRTSAAPLGLDVTSPEAASVRRSTTLGLDVSSPTAASRLHSSASLGLDVTTPDSASSLRSSAALALDLSNSVSMLMSSASLGLDVTSPESPSSIQSTAEINTSPTSFGSAELTFASSTSRAQLSGSYGGSAASLTIRVHLGGTINAGGTLVSLAFTDQSNNSLGSFFGNLSAGDVIDIGSTGLTVRFTAGSLSNGKTATTSISQADTNVSASAAFNATWGSAPRFENFQTVTAGSFTVNDTTIAVNANDSINTVLARIMASNAGVTASLSGDRITLTTNESSEDPIVVANDTSGFLAATKLTGATATTGNVTDDLQVLTKTTQFSSVATGSFTINGVAIAVDRNTDSVASIVNRINDAEAGVSAAYDSALDRLMLTATAYSADQIVVANDTTGFLAAAHLSTENTIRGHLQDDQAALSSTARFSSVANGAFTVDGHTISVATADSLQAIIARINSSGARVVASYDAATDRVILDATYDSEDDVPVGNDTSGFLGAANLSAANTERGIIRDDLQVFAKASQFSAVTNGAFTVNGVAIGVDAAQDSVATIVSKINSANAGVTATFDATTNTIQLVGTVDSEDEIVLAGDTTGFLEAAHLASANTVRGNLRDDQQVLAKTTQFASVESGSFAINGHAISIDVATDTVSSLMDKINSAGAGVTASYDSVSDTVVLTTHSSSEDSIEIADDATGFVAAAGLATNDTVRGNIRDDQQVLSKTSQFAAVATGAFDINGVSISVNAASDTLQTLVTRINASNAGVTASYDSVSDTLSITPDVAGATLALENDTSGFLTAAGISPRTVGTHVNVDAAFDATGLDAPLFDDGLSVQGGSFKINGVTIHVAADDTVRSVLARITASSAGVTAAYDDDTQLITLTTTTLTAAPIAISDDTSGFVAAVKLNESAASVVGRNSVTALNAALDLMTEYASVQAGVITVNGQSVAVNPAATSIAALVSSIDAIEGITATIDAGTGLLVVTRRGTGNVLDFSDTSGLLAALGIATGTVHGRRGRTSLVTTQTGTETVTNAGAVATSTAAAAGKLNAALAMLDVVRASAPQAARHIEAAIRNALALLGTAGVDGIALESTARGIRLDVNETALTASLTANASALPDSLAVDADLNIALGADSITTTEKGTSADVRAAIVAKALSLFSAMQASNQRVLLNVNLNPKLAKAYSRDSAERAYGSLDVTSSRTPAPSSPRSSPSR